MFKALRRLAKLLARPEVGAAGVFKSMQVKAGSRWAEAVFSNVSWLMVVSIALILLLPFSNKELGDARAITIVLVSYAIYVFILEIASRRFKAAYDRISFCIVRITINIITVSALVSFSSGQNSYFWPFYSLPVIQAIIYLRIPGIVAVTITVIILYLGTSWAAAIQLSNPLDITRLVLNSLLMALFGFAVYWIFRFAKHHMQFRMLYQLYERMNTAINLDNIFQITLEEGLRAIGTNEGSIMVLDPKTNILEIKAWLVQGEFKQGKRHRKLKLGEGIAGHAAATHRAYYSEDIRKDERFVESFTGRSLRSMLSVPIVSHGRVLCVINADSQKVRAFKESDIDLLSDLVPHIAFAIESQGLRDLGLFLPALALDQLFMEIVESACKLTGANTGYFCLLNENSGRFEEAAYFPPANHEPEIPRERGLTYMVTSTQKPITINDAQVDPRVKQAVKDQGVKALMGAPLNVRDEHSSGAKIRTIGSLFVNTEQDLEFSRRDEVLLESLANIAAIAVSNARLVEEKERKRALFKRQADQLAELHEVTKQMQSMQSEADLSKLLDYISSQAVKLVNNADSGGILLLDDERTHMTFKGSYGLSEKVVKGTRDEVGSSITGRVVKERKPFIANDIPNDPRFYNPAAEDENFLAIISTPLWSRGEIIGTLDVHSKTKRQAFSEEDHQILELMTSQAAIAIENTRIHADLEDNLRFKESLLSSAIDAIIAIDRKGIVKEFNIQAQQILGYDEEEAIGMKADQFYFEKEDAREVLYLLLKDKEVGDEGRLINHYTYIKTKEGKRIPILLSASLLGETGSVGFFRDLRVVEIYRRSIERLSGLMKAGQAITERDDLEDALGSTIEIIEKVLDADIVKLYVYDQEHEEILIPSARVAMGDGASRGFYARPDSMVKRIIDHAEIHFAENVQTDDLLGADFVADEDIRSCVACPLKIREKIVGVMICCYRAPHTFSEEEQVMIRLLASEVAISIQNAILFQQNVERVEELTQTKEYLETVLDHLEAHNKLALIGLVYGESIHSANSKLGMAMVKAADILEDYGDNDPQELKANARAIMDFIDSYLTEVNNFRKEALQLPDPVPVDLHRCLKQIIQSKRIGRNIDIKWNLLATDALITAPENQLRQVFWVVIQNALDAMADGMGSLSLETNSEMIQHADFIRVSISDTGPGIPADLREKIFEYRESDTPRSGHSGFGLIWAHSFMGSYGGMIDFETTPDKGTTFHVYVPKDFQTETPWKRPE